MTDKKPILLTQTNGLVLSVTINTPETLNSLTTDLLKELLKQLRNGENDNNVRAIFLTATGRAFSAGQNLREVAGENALPVKTILIDYYTPLIQHIRHSQKPIICGVNGPAIGAGFSLALACDLMLVATSAKFQLGFSKIGLIPDAGATYFLVNSLGAHRSARMMYTDEPLTGARAFELGLATKLFDDSTFAQSCADFMQDFQGHSMEAVAAGKQLINVALYNDLDKQLSTETDMQSALSNSADYKNRVRFFLNKKKKPKTTP